MLAVDMAEPYLLASVVTASLWRGCGFSVGCIVSSESSALPPTASMLVKHLKSECTFFSFNPAMEPRLARIAYLTRPDFPSDAVFLFSDSDTAPVNCTYFATMAERVRAPDKHIAIFDKPVAVKPYRRYAMCYMFAKKSAWVEFLGFRHNEMDAYKRMIAWSRFRNVNLKDVDELYIGYRASIWERKKNHILLDNVRDYDQNPRLPPRPYTWDTVFGKEPTNALFRSKRDNAYDIHFGHEPFALVGESSHKLLLQILAYYDVSEHTVAKIQEVFSTFWEAKKWHTDETKKWLSSMPRICILESALQEMEELYKVAVDAKAHGKPSLLDFSTSFANHASEMLVPLAMKHHPLVHSCSDDVLQTTVPLLVYVPSGKRAYQLHGDPKKMWALHEKVKSSSLYRTCNGFCFVFMDLWGIHISEEEDNPVVLTQHLYAGSKEGARKDFLHQSYAKHARSIVIPYVEPFPEDTLPIKKKTLLFYLAQGERKNVLQFRKDLAYWLQKIADPQPSVVSRFASLPGMVQWIGKNEESNLGEIFNKMRQSIFCVVPRGDSDDTRRLFSAIAVGCIPIVVSDWIVFPFEDDIEWGSFSYIVPTVELRSFLLQLRTIPEEEILLKHQTLLRCRKSFAFRHNLDDVHQNEMIDRIVQSLLKRAVLNAEYFPWAQRTAGMS